MCPVLLFHLGVRCVTQAATARWLGSSLGLRSSFHGCGVIQRHGSELNWSATVAKFFFLLDLGIFFSKLPRLINFKVVLIHILVVLPFPATVAKDTNGNFKILKWRYCTIKDCILWIYSLTWALYMVGTSNFGSLNSH
jgi:hypothetical protein